MGMKSASALSSQCMELVKNIECEDVINSEDIFKVLEEMEELEERRNLILTKFDSQKVALRIVKKKLSKSWEDNNSDPVEIGSENALDIDEEFSQAVRSVDEKKSVETPNLLKEGSLDESIDIVLTSSKSKSLDTSLTLSSSAIDTVESRMEKLFSNVDM